MACCNGGLRQGAPAGSVSFRRPLGLGKRRTGAPGGSACRGCTPCCPGRRRGSPGVAARGGRRHGGWWPAGTRQRAAYQGGRPDCPRGGGRRCRLRQLGGQLCSGAQPGACGSVGSALAPPQTGWALPRNGLHTVAFALQRAAVPTAAGRRPVPSPALPVICERRAASPVQRSGRLHPVASQHGGSIARDGDALRMHVPAILACHPHDRPVHRRVINLLYLRGCLPHRPCPFFHVLQACHMSFFFNRVQDCRG
mmetsp:Transcript_13380/g.34706  ORF Transcript_13380/g.34706 Transcript_13380/m.34706 type:complete len:253 (-) Transcript_13380:79-837(-)